MAKRTFGLMAARKLALKTDAERLAVTRALEEVGVSITVDIEGGRLREKLANVIVNSSRGIDCNCEIINALEAKNRVASANIKTMMSESNEIVKTIIEWPRKKS